MSAPPAPVSPRPKTPSRGAGLTCASRSTSTCAIPALISAGHGDASPMGAGRPPRLGPATPRSCRVTLSRTVAQAYGLNHTRKRTSSPFVSQESPTMATGQAISRKPLRSPSSRGADPVRPIHAALSHPKKKRLHPVVKNVS